MTKIIECIKYLAKQPKLYGSIKVRSDKRFDLLLAMDELEVMECVCIRREEIKMAQDVIFEYFTRKDNKRFRTLKDGRYAYVVRIHDNERATNE